MTGGTYTLLIQVPRAIELSVGALGPRRLRSGWYAYTGSALGSGGFSRVDRHRRVAAGERDVRHWHVDYLLDHDDAARCETSSARRDVISSARSRVRSRPVPSTGSAPPTATAPLIWRTRPTKRSYDGGSTRRTPTRSGACSSREPMPST